MDEVVNRLAGQSPELMIEIQRHLQSEDMKLSDVENLKKFMRKIPPVWWVSKPLIGYIERIENRRLRSIEAKKSVQT